MIIIPITILGVSVAVTTMSMAQEVIMVYKFYAEVEIIMEGLLIGQGIEWSDGAIPADNDFS